MIIRWKKLIIQLLCVGLVLRGSVLIAVQTRSVLSKSFLLETILGPISLKSVVSSSISADPKDPRPRGLRLAIIGDSVSRYHYLYLAYFLRYGEWYQAANLTVRKNILNEKTFFSWNAFYNYTNALLHPYELCDCFRRAATTNANLKIAHENRYFRDSTPGGRDNILVYIQAFGHAFATHGTLNTTSTKILDQIPDATFANFRSAGDPKSPTPNFTWSYTDWSDVVLNHLQEMSITHVLINGGLWGTRWSDTIEQQHFLSALQATNMTGIWRTTTYNSEHALLEPDTNNAMVKLFSSRQERANIAVLDASWTKDMKQSLYWDKVHFNEGPYQVLCEDLLQQVLHHDFPIDYVKFDRTTLFDYSNRSPGM